jgi:hypothetical protein
MATGKVTIAMDEVSVKTPGSLRIAFRQNAGNKIGVNIATLDPNDYITKQMFLDNTASPVPIPLSYSAGTSLPIPLNSFQALYSPFGNYPSFKIVINSGANIGQDITASATINQGTILPPTTVTINANDDGTGHLATDIVIIIKA